MVSPDTNGQVRQSTRTNTSGNLNTGRDKDFKGFDTLQIGKDPSIPDTTIIQYFNLGNVDELTPFKDTSLMTLLYHAEPSRNPAAPLHNLGPIASASFSALYNPTRSIGFHSGLRSYDPYNIYLDQFRYYKTNRTISDLYFSGLSNQQNIALKTDFSRNYANGIQLNINYQRYVNEGFYLDQKTVTTNLGLGLWYQSESDRYNMYLTYVSNVNSEQHNGGITTDSVYGQELAEIRRAIPVYLKDAQSRYQQRSVQWSNYYRLAGSKKSNWKLRLQYDLQYDWNYWNYDDDGTISSEDTVRYGAYLVDYRGARNYIRNNAWKQAAYIHGISQSGWAGKVGVQYDRHQVEQVERDSSVNDLMLKYTASIPAFGALKLHSSGGFGLGDNAGSFDIYNYINIEIGDWASLRGAFDLYRRSIDLTEDNYWLNQTKVFDTDFEKPFGSILSGKLSIPKMNSSFTLKQIIENNPIIWNQQMLPEQYDGVLSVTQLSTSLNLGWRGLHLDNDIHFQVLNESVINLPKYFSTHNLYWNGHLFQGKMNVQTGVIARVNTAYDMQRYAPFAGHFFQGTRRQETYPDLDYYMSFKVQTFRIFLQVENIANMWIGDDQINFGVEDYPYNDWKIRYGVRWMLFD